MSSIDASEPRPRSVTSSARYGLWLADGQAWELLGLYPAAEWVESLACTMQLASGIGRSTLIFLRSRVGTKTVPELLAAAPADVRASLPEDGWQPRDVRWGRLLYHGSEPHVIYELPLTESENPAWERAKLWTSVEPVYRQAMKAGGLPMHAALLSWAGQGALVAAPGGMGKSTCSRRLQPPWEGLSDDEALIVRDAQGRYHGHPFPTWSHCVERPGTRTWDVQRHMPLSAIFFLEQAGADSVEQIGPAAATSLLNKTSLADWGPLAWAWLPEAETIALRQAAFRNICEIARSVPCYILRASLTGRFWEEMERVLGEWGQ